MKRNIILVVLLVTNVFFGLSVASQQKSKRASIQGRLINFTDVVVIEDMSDLQNISPVPADRFIRTDSTGSFKITMKVESPGYYRLGRNILYLSPGDKLDVVIDNGNSRSASFKGIGSEANNYLRNTPFPKGGSYLEAGRNIKSSAMETFNTINSINEGRKTELSQLKNVSNEFIRLETARLRADLIRSFTSIKSYYSMTNRSADENRRKEFLDSINMLVEPRLAELENNFIDASLMQIVVYRDITSNLNFNDPSSSQKDVFEIKEWKKAYKLADQIRKSDKQTVTKYQASIDSFQTKKYHEALTLALKEKLKFGSGDLAIDFVANDSTKTKIPLSSLKGKVIYIDIWATWCGPCLAEMPNLEKLKEKFSGNENIAIVSLSVDDTDREWIENLRKRNPGGIQWRIDRPELKDYEVIAIPRYILIDKQFRVVNIDAPKPSDPNIEKTIEELAAKE